MQDQRRKPCDACGATADFVAQFPAPGKRGDEAPVPLVWQCRECGRAAPLVLARWEAV